MTYLRFWAVSCDEDGCDEIHEAGATTRRQAREWAKADGWAYDGLHWCPRHAGLAG